MKIEIKNRYTGDVIYSHDCDNNSIKITVVEEVISKANLSEANLTKANLTKANLTGANLSEANLTKANLTKANLTGADLTGANLSEANLSEADLTKADLSEANLTKANLFGCIGNMYDICSMQIETYAVAFTKDVLQIGCRRYSHQEWFDFHVNVIDEMDRNALVFWEKYKDFIFKAIELRFGATYD